MKFKEAFYKAYDNEQRQQLQNTKFVVTPKSAKILAFMWNIIAAADGQFDDFVFIDKNNNIISIDKREDKIVDKKSKKDKKDKEDIESSDNIKLAGDNVTGTENS